MGLGGTAAWSCVCALLFVLAAHGDDKSGVSPNAVSLPSQPGTIDGLSDGYEADLTSGTATYSIPLEVMLQATGTTPEISFDYESGGGNGILGFGWSLGYGYAPDLGGTLQRRTEQALPRYVDAPNGIDDDGDGEVDEGDEVDSFASEGGTLLVPTEDGHYFANLIGANYRYSRWCEPEPDCGEKKKAVERNGFGFQKDDPGDAPSRNPIYPDDAEEYSCVPAPTQEDGAPCADGWLAQYPDGYGAYLGQSAESRILNPVTGDIFAWLIDEEFDTTQNRNIYKYISFDDDRNWNQKYLSEIEIVNYSTWSDNVCTGTYPWSSYTYAHFTYEDRDDMIESCESGFPVRTGKRLREVVMAVQGIAALPGHLAGDFNNDGVEDFLVRRYVLEYKPGHWSYLSSVTQYGADGVSALPPMTMTYANCDLPDEVDVSGSVIYSVNTPRSLMDLGSVDITELNGDGLVDILKTEPAGGLHTAFINLGESVQPDGKHVITWADGRAIQGDSRTMNINLQEDTGYSAYLADMDADGLSDLVYDADETYYFPLRQASVGVPTWSPRTRMNIYTDDSYPPSPFGTEHASYDDFNNDGRSDVIQSIRVGPLAYFRVWYNLGGSLYTMSQTVNQENVLTLNDDGASLEDFNGDGLADLVRVVPTGVEVSRGLGYGKFDVRERALLPDFTLNISQAQAASLEDVNSDGLPDLLIERAAPGEIWYWLNLGDYRFDHRRKFTGVPTPIGTSPAVRWADINGNATADLIYADRYSSESLRAIDFGDALGCDLVQGLLTKIENGVGGSVSFEYGTSVEFQLADAAAGRPWPDTIPEAQLVIKTKTESDSYGDDYVTRYVYHDGFYKYYPDYDSFAGFGEVEEITEGDVGAPTIVHRLRFDVGREDPAFRGSITYESNEDENGGIFWEENTEFEKTVLYTGTDGREIAAVNPKSRVRNILELGAGTPRRLETEYEYDEFNNQTLEANYGIVEAGDRSAFDDETITRSIWTWNCLDWIVVDLAREDVEDYAGNLISRHEIYYDNETFLDDRFRFAIYSGNTRELMWPDPSNLDEFVEMTRIKYDLSGNFGTIIDGLAVCDEEGTPDDNLGHYQVDDYEDQFQAYIEKSTLHIGDGKADLVAEYDWDYGFGTPVAARDFSGQETRYKYDVFGRLIAIIRPGNTDEFPTTEFEYSLAIPFGDGLINYVEERTLDKAPNTPGLSHNDHYERSRTYYDGMGRELLTKTETEPDPVTGGPRVVVTGSGNWSPRGNVAEDFNDYFSAIPGDTLDELLAYEDIGADGWTAMVEVDGNLMPFGFDDCPRTVHEFDAQLREIKTTNPDGTLQSTTFEPLRRIVYDEVDNDPASPYFNTPTIMTYDGQDRLVQVDEQVYLNDDGTPGTTLNTWSTRYGYRADGLLTTIVDAQNNTRHYDYDGLQRLISRNDPDIGITENIYDDASNLIAETDGKDASSLFTYDGANRLRTVDIKDEGQPFSYGYNYDPDLPLDEATNRADIVYFFDDPVDAPIGGSSTTATRHCEGRLARVLDTAGSYYYSYDERGRQEFEVSYLPHPQTGALVPYQANFAYDDQDRLTMVEYPDGDRVGYRYNERGLLSGVEGGGPMHPDGGAFLMRNAAYNPAGQRSSMIHGDGLRTTRAYNTRGALVRLTVARPAAPEAPVLDYLYSRNAKGTVIRIDDLRPESIHPEGDFLRNTQIMTMDDLDRLIAIQYSFAAPGNPDRNDGTINYRYDRLGNLLAQTSDIVDIRDGRSVVNLGNFSVGGGLGSSNRDGFDDSGPGPNALTKVEGPDGVREFLYDDAGALSDLDGVSQAYDYDGKLVQAENDTFVSQYTYDYSGLRVLKRVWDKLPGGERADIPKVFVQYLSDYFEIREFEQVNKYVYDGEDTLALVTGTLTPGLTRYQRFLVSPGWNLLSLAVDAPDAVDQLGPGEGVVLAVWSIDQNTGEVTQLESGDTLSPGSAFWLYALAADSLEVSGLYDDAVATRATQQGFVALGQIGATELDAVLPANAESVWAWDADRQHWRIKFFGDNDFLSDMPGFVENGQAFYVRLGGPGDIVSEPVARGIDYYHGDHLTSSNIITDGAGNVVEENVYYPFGAFRRRNLDPSHTPNPFQFINRERDDETGLHSFGERYMATELGRFVTSDPLLDEVPEEYLLDPQQLNPYSYARNSPLTLYDPQGERAKSPEAQQRRDARLRTRFEAQITSPFKGLSGMALSLKRDQVFGNLKVAKGGSLPKFTNPVLDRLQSFENSRMKIKEIQKSEGKFDIANFEKLNKFQAGLNGSNSRLGKFDKGQIGKALFDVTLGKDARGRLTGTRTLKADIKKQIENINTKYLETLTDDKRSKFDAQVKKALDKKGFEFDPGNNSQSKQLRDLFKTLGD